MFWRPNNRTQSSSQRGFTCVETTVTLGIVSILALAGFASVDLGGVELTVAQHEVRAALDQAFLAARARGSAVQVAFGTPALGPDIIPVQLGHRVRWGKPAHVPLPPGMEDPKRADTEGEAHRRITVTPRHTATASAWFLNDGQDVVCMRLSGRGTVKMLRWRKSLKKWTVV